MNCVEWLIWSLGCIWLFIGSVLVKEPVLSWLVWLAGFICLSNVVQIVKEEVKVKCGKKKATENKI